MRIKKLELIGFKSFKDRTVIQFDAGITGVVGPNGCGKSNIVDALVWVMGEMSAKHLRGSSMEDVIFAGSEGYAPVGMAEVSLTLENDGGAFPVQYMKFSEVMVTRRLHRSGESEYFVNKEPARLRDIQEIFMDTGAGSKGFSIVEQGAIGKIITAKPEDRRTLIEEAAGITKFKARKRESQRKLISTEQNLVRLHDIVGELKRQIDSLQRQAQRAERYRNLKKEIEDLVVIVTHKGASNLNLTVGRHLTIEDLELWLNSLQFVESQSQFNELSKEKSELQVRTEESKAQFHTLEARLATLRLEVSVKEADVQSRSQRVGELQNSVREAESTIQNLRFEIEQARRNQEMTGGLLQEIEVRRTLLEADLSSLNIKLEDAEKFYQGVQTNFELQKTKLDEIQNRIQEADDSLTSARRELLTTSQGESHLLQKQSALTESVRQGEERVDESRLVLTELSTKRMEFETRRKRVFTELERERQMQFDLSQDIETIEANRKLAAEQLEARRLEIETLKDELNSVTGTLYGLENLQTNFEGFESGVKSVLFWQRKKNESLAAEQQVQHFRPVSEVVEVPAEYELAMESALGPRLQMLLVDSSEPALGAIDYLKNEKLGRSSFYNDAWSSDGMQAMSESRSSLRTEPNLRALLLDLVSVPDAHKKSVQKLLDGVAVVEDLSTAMTLKNKYPDWTFVTPQGDCLDRVGVLTAGTEESADSGLLKRRREIKELSLRKEECAGKLALGRASIRKLEENLASLEQDLETREALNTEKEILLAGLRKDLERADQELNNAVAAISRQEKDLLGLQSQVDARRAELEDVQTRRQALEQKRSELEGTVESLTLELLQSRQGVEDLSALVTKLQVEAATRREECEGMRRQKEILDRSLVEVLDQLGRMSEEREKSKSAGSVHQIELEQKRIELEMQIGELESLQADVRTRRNEYEEMHAELRQSEEGLLSVRTRMVESEGREHELGLKIEQLQMKLSYLRDQMQERYFINLDDVASQHLTRVVDGLEVHPNEGEKQLKELKDKLSKIGDVNLAAIQEYEEVNTRYQFLSQQTQDLVDAKENLKRVIDRINRICSKRFKETFDQVNERFVKVFPVLFGGGEARLILVEDPEKNEMGIDIVAKPPGKKMQSVTLLSGGEKALTAVSLIFSIFLVKPSPYCLLDEVDAPLDDANVFRFNDLVREMAKRSQIILVTHNKYTMEVASRLYGVTMQEKGVSRMVSVNLGEARTVVEAMA